MRWCCRGRAKREKTLCFCSCKLHHANMSKTLVSPRFRKQLFELWEPRESGNAETNQRLGMSVTPAMRIRCSLASPSKDSSESVIKVWIFSTLRRSCILCKWGARQAAGFRQEPRRSATEFTDAFNEQVAPKTANLL